MIISECCESWVDIPMAKQMIKVSHEINPEGLVKFQLHDPEDTGFTQWTKSHALTFDQAKELFDYGDSIGQEVFFSVFAPIYVDWCERIGVKRIKIAHCEETNTKLLKQVRDTHIRTIISSDKNWEGWLTDNLYCPEGYPPLITKMPYFKSEECKYIGFSDHTLNLDIPKIALSRGAQLLECHFILDKSLPSPDAQWSKTPEDIEELIRFENICHSTID